MTRLRRVRKPLPTFAFDPTNSEFDFVRELLRLCGDQLAQDVEADLAAMPEEMRTRWRDSRR